MDELVVVDESDSNDDNAIAELVTANPEYLLPIAPIGNKLSSGLAVVANQIRFTATTKNIANKIGDATTGIGISSIGGNGMGVGGRNGIGSGSNNSVGSAGEVGIGFVGVGFGAEVGVGDNPGDVVVCFGGLSTMATDPASFRFNVKAPTSFTAGFGHSTPISFVVQIG